MKEDINDQPILSSSKEDEINLKSIFNFFLRNKRLISLTSLSFLILSSLYSLFVKRTWEGQFQIVLNSNTNATNPIINSRFPNLFSNPQERNLLTQVEILQSPSVLMPIFEFALSQNYQLTKENTFSKWKKNLNIDLEDGTTVLNIAYRDTDKKRILPVLEKISLTYQKYSVKNRERNQALETKYLISQIENFKVLSSQSLKKAQEFAIDQDLIYYDSSLNTSSNEISKKDLLSSPFRRNASLTLSNTDIENIRVQAVNEIRTIDLQLKKIEELGNDVEKLQYIGSTIPALVDDGLPQELAGIEKNLVQLESLYKQNDMLILRQKERRNLIIKLLKKRTIGYLKAKRVEAQAKKEAAMRPKGILLKYKELIRQAQRDESTLLSLEDKLRISELEASRKKDPWKLITNPTLLKSPVGTSRKSIAFGGLIIGALIGSSFAFYKEKKSGKVFESEILLKFLSIKIFEFITINDLDSELNKISLFKEYINSKSTKKINLISLSEIDKDKIQKIEDHIQENNKNKKIINQVLSFEKLKFSFKSDLNLLIVNMDLVTYSQLFSLKKYLNEFEISIDGVIFLNY